MRIDVLEVILQTEMSQQPEARLFDIEEKNIHQSHTPLSKYNENISGFLTQLDSVADWESWFTAEWSQIQSINKDQPELREGKKLFQGEDSQDILPFSCWETLISTIYIEQLLRFQVSDLQGNILEVLEVHIHMNISVVDNAIASDICRSYQKSRVLAI